MLLVTNHPRWLNCFVLLISVNKLWRSDIVDAALVLQWLMASLLRGFIPPLAIGIESVPSQTCAPLLPATGGWIRVTVSPLHTRVLQIMEIVQRRMCERCGWAASRAEGGSRTQTVKECV